MVATRRGARTGTNTTASRAETSATRAKKSTRKVASKSLEPTPPKIATRSRVTRSKLKKSALEDQSQDTTDEHSDEEPELPQTRQTTVRTKVASAKPPKSVPEPETAPEPTHKLAPKKSSNSASVPSVKSARLAPSRIKKAQVLDQEDPKLPTAVSTRTTRLTRGKAATEKSKVLSPKKITQVSRQPLKVSKAPVEKSASIKGGQAKGAVSARNPRRRGVSDENEDAAGTAAGANRRVDNLSERANLGASTKLQRRPVIELHSDTEMTSGTTTPADSPKLDSSNMVEHPDQRQSDELDVQDVEDEDESSSGSEDEICGPKTPMRRCSPREAARYSASPRRIMGQTHSGSPVRTPHMSLQQPAARIGTPRTHEPRPNERSQVSWKDSMTVARARDRAMVFQELKPIGDSFRTSKNDTLFEQPPHHETQHVSLDDLMPDSLSSVLEAETEEVDQCSAPCQQSPDASSQTGPFLPENPVNASNSIASSAANALDYHHNELEDLDNTSAEIAGNEYDFSFDTSMHSNAEGYGLEVFEDDDSVIIASHRNAIENSSPIQALDSCPNELCTSTPKPETLVWENIRHDEPTSIDLHYGGSTPENLPAPDETEVLSPTASYSSHQTSGCATPEVAEEVQIQDGPPNGSHHAFEQRRSSITSTRYSLDATVHFSQFIDVDCLPSIPCDHQTDCLAGDHTDSEHNAEEDIVERAIPMTTPTRTTDCEQAHMREELGTPRYARPTMASASKRRNSLPAIRFNTMLSAVRRPITADGTVTPQLPASPRSWKAAMSDLLMFSTAKTAFLPSHPDSTLDYDGLREPVQISKTPRFSIRKRKTLSTATPRLKRPRESRADAPRTVAGVRFLGSPSRFPQKLYHDAWAEEVPAIDTVEPSRATDAERFPGLPSCSTYEELVQTPMATNDFGKSPQTPLTIRTARRIVSETRRSDQEHLSTPNSREYVAATPVSSSKERIAGLPPRKAYEEHAKTVMVPTRFRSPLQVPSKRPASAMKASSLQNLARKARESIGTPVKTPLKPPGMTPGQVPMTPHPAAPLKGVYALVDVWTNDASPASSAFIALLQRLGAKTTKSWSKHMTHLIFKGGSPGHLQRLTLHNKEVAASGMGVPVFCVNSRWVSDCDAEGMHVDESDEKYAVDIDAYRGSKRRRKSMEPAALVNVGSNSTRRRKSSFGRPPISHLVAKQSVGTPSETEPDKENDKSRAGSSSPATPAYLAAPNLLVQQTAPLKRVKKLALGAKEQSEKRRMTTLYPRGQQLQPDEASDDLF